MFPEKAFSKNARINDYLQNLRTSFRSQQLYFLQII